MREKRVLLCAQREKRGGGGAVVELLLLRHLFPPFGLSVGLSPSPLHCMQMYMFFYSPPPPPNDSSHVVLRPVSPSSPVPVFHCPPPIPARCGPTVAGCGSDPQIKSDPAAGINPRRSCSSQIIRSLSGAQRNLPLHLSAAGRRLSVCGAAAAAWTRRWFRQLLPEINPRKVEN